MAGNYRIYRDCGGWWLREIVLEDGRLIGEHWTRERAEAMTFPGAKACRRVLELLGGGPGLWIINGRGETVK